MRFGMWDDGMRDSKKKPYGEVIGGGVIENSVLQLWEYILRVQGIGARVQLQYMKKIVGTISELNDTLHEEWTLYCIFGESESSYWTSALAVAKVNVSHTHEYRTSEYVLIGSYRIGGVAAIRSTVEAQQSDTIKNSTRHMQYTCCTILQQQKHPEDHRMNKNERTIGIQIQHSTIQ